MPSIVNAPATCAARRRDVNGDPSSGRSAKWTVVEHCSPPPGRCRFSIKWWPCAARPSGRASSGHARWHPRVGGLCQDLTVELVGPNRNPQFSVWCGCFSATAVALSRANVRQRTSGRSSSMVDSSTAADDDVGVDAADLMQGAPRRARRANTSCTFRTNPYVTARPFAGVRAPPRTAATPARSRPARPGRSCNTGPSSRPRSGALRRQTGARVRTERPMAVRRPSAPRQG